MKHFLALLLLAPVLPLAAQQAGIEQSSELLVVPAGDKFLRWHGHEGRSYFLQVSDANNPLAKWFWAPVIEGGNDKEISYEVDGTAAKGFFRLKYTDQVPAVGKTLETADFDNDTLSNLTEITQHQTDPLSRDSDGDGLPDNWEIAHGLLPLDNGSGNVANGPTGFFGSSGGSNRDAYGAGVLSISGASLDDLDGDGIDNDEDASSRDPAIKWASAQVTGYAMIEIDLPGDVLPHPNDLNNESDVLFGGGKWIAGDWSELSEIEESGEIEFGEDIQIGYTSQLTYWSHFLPEGNFLAEVYFSVGSSMGYSGTIPHLGVLTPASGTVVSTETVDWATESSIGGLGSLATDDNGRIYAIKTDTSTSPEIWLLNTGLQKTGAYSLPSGYYPRSSAASASGWFATSSYPGSDGSIPPTLTVWNPAGTLIGVPLHSGHDFLDLSDLPDGSTILCADTGNSNSTALVSNEDDTALIPIPSISDKDVTHFAGDGTGMTDDHKLWRNGALAPLRDLSKGWADYDDMDWLLFPFKANKSGVWLVNLLEPWAGEEKTALMIPSSLQARDPESGKTQMAVNATISDPRPDVTVSLESATLNADGTLSIRVQGSVEDHLSEAVASGRISQLHFSVNGEVLRSINLSYGPGQAPWTLADSLNEFDETLVISNPKPGAYEVRVETDENPAGNTGWGRVAVGLARETDSSATATTFNGLSVALGQIHSASVIDTITVYFGNRPPLVGDAVFTESAANSGTFAGVLNIGGQNQTCTLSISEASQFQGAAVDHLSAELTFANGGSQRKVLTSFQETAAGSLRFYPDGFQVNGEINRVYQLAALPGSQPGSFEPLVMKAAVPESWVEIPGFQILVNGDEHTVKKLTVDGKEDMYVVNSAADTHPKLFIPCRTPLSEDHSVTGDNVPGGVIRWEIQFDGQTAVMQETVLLAGSPPEEGGIAAQGFAAASSTTGWQSPGDTITWTDLETAYKFIYPDELSQTLLRVYLAEGHEIDLTDVLGDFDFSYLGRVGTKALIKIEDDDAQVHPGIAAQYLWMGLNKALVSYSFRAAVAAEIGEDTLEIAFLQAYKAQVGPAAAKTGVAAAELYLSGISIVSEPLDWLLVVNDVSQGHYASLAAALPFVSTGIVAAGRAVRIENQAGQVLGRLDASSLPALQNALPTRDLKTIGTVLDDYQISTYIGKLIAADGGWVKVPKRERGLKDAMKRRLVKPNDSFHAHHDFPWEHKKWFADHGINVNAPAFGRWVHEIDHKTWHKGAGGGDFNDYWLTFIQEENAIGAPRKTISDILAKLEECRQAFQITITE